MRRLWLTLVTLATLGIALTATAGGMMRLTAAHAGLMGWKYGGLTFTAETDSTVCLVASNSAPSVELEVSMDRGLTWSAYSVGDEIAIAKDRAVCFRSGASGNQSMGAVNSSGNIIGYHTFVMSGRIAASGSILSLLDREYPEDISLTKGCFAYLFDGCTSLTTIPYIPSTIIPDRAYIGLFRACISLTHVNNIPITTAGTHSMTYMFFNCRNINSLPDTIPLTRFTGNESCYNMFGGCRSIKTAPNLPATTLGGACYSAMFNACWALSKAPNLPATNATAWCYVNMFRGCESLEKPPEIALTNAKEASLREMFFGCKRLKSSPKLHIVNPPETTSGKEDRGCFYMTFSGCTSLTSVETDQSSFNGCSNWLPNNIGTFKCTQTLKDVIDALPERTSSNVPTNWTIDPSL